MHITDIGQSLSTLVANYLECQKCRLVDRNSGRMKGGYVCPVCGYISQAGRLYFSINIHILIDLIQESYHLGSSEPVTEKLYEGSSSHDISVVIFFCTLKEALMDNLIIQLLKANNLPDGVCERLLSDNKFHIQKQDKLFKSLSGIKWSAAISKLNNRSEIDYKDVDEFIKKVSGARNHFIHDGSKWSIDRELSTDCVNNLFGLISIYAELHNDYVHPHYLSRPLSSPS